MNDMTMEELIVSLHGRISQDGKRIADLETECGSAAEEIGALNRRIAELEAALAERDQTIGLIETALEDDAEMNGSTIDNILRARAERSTP